MRDVIISDYACSDAVCVKLLAQLWPKDRPLVMTIPATGMSEAHRSWVESFRQAHGGKFLEPFIAQKMKWSDVRSISLVGFSAGCWGVREILTDPSDADLVTFVYACDGLHGTYVDGRVSVQEPWLRYAARAASGDALMVVSFSSIIPPGYPSTRESAIELGREVGAAWLSPAPGGFANCLPSCGADGSVGAQEFGQAGNVVLVGAWPPGTAGTDAAAHVYQANAVQSAVWRTYLAPWLQNQPISGVERGSKRKWSSLLVLGVGLVAFGASVRLMRNERATRMENPVSKSRKTIPMSEFNVVVHPKHEWPYVGLSYGTEPITLGPEIELHTTQKVVSSELVERKKDQIVQGEPVFAEVFRTGGRWWIVDGHHAIAAARSIGKPIKAGRHSGGRIVVQAPRYVRKDIET